MNIKNSALNHLIKAVQSSYSLNVWRLLLSADNFSYSLDPVDEV